MKRNQNPHANNALKISDYLDTMLLTLWALLGLVYKCIIETLIPFHTCQLAQFFLASPEIKG